MVQGGAPVMHQWTLFVLAWIYMPIARPKYMGLDSGHPFFILCSASSKILTPPSLWIRSLKTDSLVPTYSVQLLIARICHHSHDLQCNFFPLNVKYAMPNAEYYKIHQMPITLSHLQLWEVFKRCISKGPDDRKRGGHPPLPSTWSRAFYEKIWGIRFFTLAITFVWKMQIRKPSCFRAKYTMCST